MLESSLGQNAGWKWWSGCLDSRRHVRVAWKDTECIINVAVGMKKFFIIPAFYGITLLVVMGVLAGGGFLGWEACQMYEKVLRLETLGNVTNLAENVYPARVRVLVDQDHPLQGTVRVRLERQLRPVLELDDKLLWLAMVEIPKDGNAPRLLLEVPGAKCPAGAIREALNFCVAECSKNWNRRQVTAAGYWLEDGVEKSVACRLVGDVMGSDTGVLILGGADEAAIRREAVRVAVVPWFWTLLLAGGMGAGLVCRRKVKQSGGGPSVLAMWDAGIALWAGLILTILICWRLDFYYETEGRKEFRSVAGAYEQRVVRSLTNVKRQGTEAIARFRLSSGRMDAHAFEIFTEYLRDYPGVDAWGWVDVVGGEGLEDYTRLIRARDGLSSFEVWEWDAERNGRAGASGREVYYPVSLAVPAKAREQVLGFDMGSEEMRAETIEIALSERLPMITPLRRMMHHEAQTSGFIVLHPVYDPAGDGPLLGLAVAALPVDEIFSAVLGGNDRVEFDLYQAGEDGWVHVAGTGAGMPPPLDGRGMFPVRPVLAFGRTYAIRSQPVSGWWGYRQPTWIVLVTGLVFSGFMAHAVGVSGRRRERLEAAVVERTREIEAAEGKFRLITDNATDVIWVMDVETRRFRFVSPAVTRVLGYEAGEIEGMALEELLTPMFRENVEARIRSLLKDYEQDFARVYVMVAEHPRKNGGTVWSETTARFVEDEDTGRMLIYGTSRDITERRRVEHALRESESRFETLAGQSRSYLWEVDMKGVFTYVDPVVEEILGFRPEELLGTFIWDTHPLEGRDAARLWGQEILHLGRSLAHYENPMVAKNGKVMWFSTTGGAIVDAQGVRTGYRGIDTDITATRETNERLRVLAKALDSAVNIVVITDALGAIEWVNRAFCETTGYTREEAMGKNPRELIKSGRHDQPFYEKMWSTIQAGRVWSGEIVNRKKDGTLYPEEVTITPVKNEAGEIRHFIAIKRDLTHEKAQEQRSLRAQRMESIGTLAGGIAHDLNNALAPILVSVDLLREAEDKDEREQFLHNIEVSARRSAEMVKQVLGFARGVSGERVPTDPRVLLRDLQKLIRDTFPKNITFEMQNPEVVGLVLCDPTQLHQVLLNLCVNARDAMPHGGTLGISVENTRLAEASSSVDGELVVGRTGDYVKITVRDTGSGIPKDHLEQIFDPFFTTKETGKGTGLGLSTSHSIIKGHGGFFHVVSELGRGSVFEVYIPAHHATAEPAIQQAGEEEQTDGAGKTVLLVDDEELVRKSVRKLLENAGFRVLTACNGWEAVNIFEKECANIDVVLTDVAMPVMDGPSAARIMRGIKPGLSVIATSGQPIADDTGTGIRHFLSKPYTRAAILKTIRAALDDP